MDKKVEKLLSSKKGDEFLRKLKDAAKSILGEKYLAEDVVQDTFEYFCHRDVPVSDAAEVEPYMVTTVANRAKKMKKKLAKTMLLDIEDLEQYIGHYTATDHEEEQQYATMIKCIKQLDVQSQRVFKLRYIKAMSVKTVATMMKMSESKVNRIAKKAMTDVTKMVNDEKRTNE